ncbi:MAG: sigma-70 family RNA polymerase sigma factor [Acidobacteriota bacterium]
MSSGKRKSRLGSQNGYDQSHVRESRAEWGFDELFREYFPRLVAVARPLTRDSALAEDVAQETLSRLHARAGLLDFSEPIWPWLKTVAMRLAIDHVRRDGRETPTEPYVLITDKEPHGREDQYWCEEGPQLILALKELSARQRLAVALRYLEDKDPADAAILLGLSKPAFEQLLFRARRKLLTEYRRITEGAASLIVLPLRKMRSEINGFLLRIRSMGARDGRASLAISDTFVQAASGLLALWMTVTAGPGGVLANPAPPARNLKSIAASDGHEDRGGSPRKKPLNDGGGGRAVEGDSRVPNGNTPEGNEIDRTVRDLTDPNRGTKDPEDARITSVAFEPSSDGRVVYAAGIAHCRLPTCPPVLFRSTNGGEEWSRLPARELAGTSLVLPDGNDPRIFVMGPAGLQVSEDGGRSFGPAAAAGASFAIGSVAISPAFHEGDPRILIGAQNLMRYHDERKVIEPEPVSALPGPLEPMFAPAYPADPRLLIGGLRLNGVGGRVVATVFVCSDSICSETPIPGQDQIPKVRLPENFLRSNRAYAFTQNGLFLSSDGGSQFVELDTPWQTGLLMDVALLGTGRGLFAAVQHVDDGQDDGLYLSRDGGDSWQRIRSPLFENGASAVAFSQDRIVVALGRSGVACSSDHGITWSARCS